MLWLRVYRKRSVEDADRALTVHDAFVQTVLLGQHSDGKKTLPDTEDARQVSACQVACLLQNALL